jgi:hypothetical protein
MRRTVSWPVAVLVSAVFTLSSPALAETPQMKLRGLIHDYTVDAVGPWQVVGEWALTVNRARGKVDFLASLSMVRSEIEPRAAHTHHMRLTEGHVTTLPNGFRISGTALFTSNGNLAGFSGSPVDIEITGSAAVAFSNVAVTFGGAAVSHFGSEPLTGVVTYRLKRG